MSLAYTTELRDLLARRGFTRLAMRRNKTGHLQMTGSLARRPVELLVDTGASATVLDLGYCRQRGLTLKETTRQGGGAGGTVLTLHVLDRAELELGGAALPSKEIHALDLSHVNQGLTARGADPIHGVIGADILLRHEAVIDYADRGLFLRLMA